MSKSSGIIWGVITVAAVAGVALWYFRKRDSYVSVEPVPDVPTPLLPDLTQPGGIATPGVNLLFDLQSPQGTTKSLLDILLGSNTLDKSAPGGGAASPFSQPYLSADIGGGTGYVVGNWQTPKLGDSVVFSMGDKGTRTETVVFDGYRWEPQFQDASAKYGIPPGVLSRLAWQESRYNPNAFSIAGARGMMQIVPKWYPQWSVENLLNPNKAIYYAASILADNYKKFYDWPKAIVAYNQGVGNVNKAIANAVADGKPYDWLNYSPIGSDGRGYVGIAQDAGLTPKLIAMTNTPTGAA